MTWFLDVIPVPTFPKSTPVVVTVIEIAGMTSAVSVVAVSGATGLNVNFPLTSVSPFMLTAIQSEVCVVSSRMVTLSSDMTFSDIPSSGTPSSRISLLSKPLMVRLEYPISLPSLIASCFLSSSHHAEPVSVASVSPILYSTTKSALVEPVRVNVLVPLMGTVSLPNIIDPSNAHSPASDSKSSSGVIISPQVYLTSNISSTGR